MKVIITDNTDDIQHYLELTEDQYRFWQWLGDNKIYPVDDDIQLVDAAEYKKI